MMKMWLKKTLVVFASAGWIGSSMAQEDAATYIEKGKTEYRSKDFEGAVSTFRAAVALDPQAYDAQIGLGRSLEKLKRFEEAARVYSEAVPYFPDRGDFQYRLGIVYRKLEQYDKSVNAYLAYQKIEPDDPNSWYGLGEAYRQGGKTEKAIEAYREYTVRETRPKEQKYVDRAAELIVELEAQVASSKPVEAEPPKIPETTETSETTETPETTEVPEETGESTETAEVPTDPEVVLPEKPNVAPEDSVPENVDLSALRESMGFASAGEAVAAGDAAFEAERYDEAAAAYEAAYALQPDDHRAPYKMGVALAILGDTGAAIDAWEIALGAEPGLQLATDNIERAKRRLAVDAVLDSPKLYGDADERGALTERYLDQGRFVMALRSATALFELAPADPATHRALARAHLGLGHPELALDALKKEMSLQPGDFGLYQLMGEAHTQLEEPRQALYFYELFLGSVDPDGANPELDEIRARLELLRSGVDLMQEGATTEAEASSEEASSNPLTIVPEGAEAGDKSKASPNTLVP